MLLPMLCAYNMENVHILDSHNRFSNPCLLVFDVLKFSPLNKATKKRKEQNIDR